MSNAREPVPFEVYERGVYLHGTKAELAVGELLVPGREVDWVGHSPEKLQGMRDVIYGDGAGQIED